MTPVIVQHQTLITLNESRPSSQHVQSMSVHWTSPIHILPPELLIQIFSQYIEWYKDCIEKTGVGSQPTTSLQTRKGPWLLSHICQDWRQLVLPTAQFWSHIRINHKVNSREADEELLRYTNLTLLQVVRSQDAPLSVYLEFHCMKSPRNWFDLLLDYCNIILHNCHRWKVFEVYDHCCELVARLNTLVPMECPMLEHLALHVVTMDFESTPDVLSSSAPRLLIKDRCQSLRSVELRGPNTYFPTLPWAQLQRFRLHDVYDLDSYHVVFREMANLQTLELTDCLYNGATPPVVVFPSLRVLKLKRTPAIFGWIKTPLLEDLSVAFQKYIGIHRTREMDIAELISFIQNSQCSIRTLQFNPTSGFGHDVSQLNSTLLASLLQVTPALQRLSLTLICGDNTDLHQLAETFMAVLNADPPNNRPELRQLSLVCREEKVLHCMGSISKKEHQSIWESLAAHEGPAFVSAMKERGIGTAFYCRGIAAPNSPTKHLAMI